MLTQEYLKEALTYNPETGVFVWNKRPRRHFNTIRGCNTFNGQFAGNVAGGVTSGKKSRTEYLQIVLNGKKYKLHRLVWFIETGAFPDKHIDHINGDGLDNRFVNLRDVSNQENHKNSPRQLNNTSGYTGVSWSAQNSKWNAYIKIDGKRKHLGYFNNIDDAVSIRRQHEEKHKFHKNHGR